jgi:hypothetical protein
MAGILQCATSAVENKDSDRLSLFQVVLRISDTGHVTLLHGFPCRDVQVGAIVGIHGPLKVWTNMYPLTELRKRDRGDFSTGRRPNWFVMLRTGRHGSHQSSALVATREIVL